MSDIEESLKRITSHNGVMGVAVLDDAGKLARYVLWRQPRVHRAPARLRRPVCVCCAVSSVGCRRSSFARAARDLERTVPPRFLHPRAEAAAARRGTQQRSCSFYGAGAPSTCPRQAQRVSWGSQRLPL